MGGSRRTMGQGALGEANSGRGAALGFPSCCRVSPEGLIVDQNATVGYMPDRQVGDLTLRIGPDAHVRSGTVIYAGSTVGRGLSTGHNVVIREQNEIGDNFSIWSNSVVDYGCRIGSNVKVHTNCYIPQFTTIEDDVFIGPGATFANDPHPGCPRFRECMRGPTIKRGAKIGANVTVLPFVTIGECALIGAGAVVTKDVPSEAVVVGNPGSVLSWVRELTCPKDLLPGPYPCP